MLGSLQGWPTGAALTRAYTRPTPTKSLIEEYSLQRSFPPPHVAKSGATWGFPFFVDPFIQNVLSLKPCVQILSRFHRLIPRVENFKTRSDIDRFWRTFCSQKKTDEKAEPGALVFPFRKEARPCLSRNHNGASHGSKTMPLAKGKKQKTHFFFVSERHGCASPESTTVPLAEGKKNRKRGFLFPRGTTVPLMKAQPCLSRKQNRASREREKK